MIDWGFIWNAAIVVVSICVLAYFVPGIALRAINDFKNRHKKSRMEDFNGD